MKVNLSKMNFWTCNCKIVLKKKLFYLVIRNARLFDGYNGDKYPVILKSDNRFLFFL
jgi:hypothetical protein